MEILMDFILEILEDGIGSGVRKLTGSRRTPKPIRYAVTALLVLFYIAAIAVLIFAAVTMFSDGSSAVGLFFCVLSLAVIIAGVLTLRGVVKRTISNDGTKG